MAISLLQHAQLDTSGTLTPSKAYASNVTAGSSLIAMARIGGTSQTLTWSDNNGNTWATDVAEVWVAGLGAVLCGSAHNVNAGATTVKITLGSSTTTCRMAIAEVSWGTGFIGAFDVGVQNNGATNTQIDSGGATTSNSSIYIAGFAGNNAGDTFTAGTGYTLEEQIPAAPNSRACFEDQIPGASGTYHCTFSGTSGSNSGWAALVAIYKAVAVAGDTLMGQALT